MVALLQILQAGRQRLKEHIDYSAFIFLMHCMAQRTGLEGNLSLVADVSSCIPETCTFWDGHQILVLLVIQ